VPHSHSVPTCKAAEPTTEDRGHEALLRELATLRRSEAILRDFIETSTIGLHSVGGDGTILWVNQAELDLLGYAREEYVGRNIAEFHADASVIEDLLGRLSRGETLLDHPARLRHHDGSIRHVLINSSVLFGDGKFVHTRCFTRDVTALRQEREAHRLLAAIVDSSDDAIFSKSLDGIIESWNAGAERLFGYAPEEIIGKSMSVLLPPDELSEFPGILARIRAGAHLEHYEVTRLRKDGQRVHVSATVSPLRDSAGCLVGTSTIARDITDRMRADAALRRSEERFRFAQLAARIGTFDLDIKTGVNTWTPELAAMHGLAPGGCPPTQAAWRDLLHPDDRERVLQLVESSIETGTSAEADWRVVWPDQTTHWITGRWQVFKDAAGEPLRMMGINIDISDRKRVEEALRQSEERFRLAIKATNDAIWDIDLDTGVVAWNDTYSALYGRPPDTSNSWQWWVDRIHPDDREGTAQSLRAAISSNASSWTWEYRFQRASGAWADIYDRAYISRDSSGKAWRVIGAMQDLTDRKQAEASLRESEERFRRVFEEGPLGLALVGRDFRYLKVNSALCEMVGYSEAEMLGMSFADITHPDDVQADVEQAERLFRREIPFYRMQERFVTKGGATIWINLTATVIADSKGEPLYGLGMVENITEVKRAQEEALARQKLESVGTLASGIAHDFNNLLGAVQAQGELALAELDAGSCCKEELKAICEVAKRGSEIVRQLMIYAGKESEIVERVDLSKIVAEMLALLRVSVSKHAGVDADLGQDLPATSASAAQLRQIVMNLMTNASDAIGDRDGVIRVITRRVAQGTESARDSESSFAGDSVALEVSDTGCGMSRETLDRLFDPFFTTKSAGRGLGLAVVSGIVRSLGGSIDVTSEPGKGSTFQILLPCAETGSATTSDALPAVEGLPRASQQAAVLIVEDEEVLRHAVAKALGKHGFAVFEAADGSFAIDFLRANGGEIDAILLDMTIPGASSLEVIAEAVKVRPDIRVVLASAYSQEMFFSATSVPQIKRFIRKPFQLADLVKTLRSSLAS
jgi:PAS domain S-box-containing protein